MTNAAKAARIVKLEVILPMIKRDARRYAYKRGISGRGTISLSLMRHCAVVARNFVQAGDFAYAEREVDNALVHARAFKSRFGVPMECLGDSTDD